MQRARGAGEELEGKESVGEKSGRGEQGEMSLHNSKEARSREANSDCQAEAVAEGFDVRFALL